ncbi:alpha/beta hydrolase family protein [Aureibacter tunicatorum]|uniref:Pimeloyl-ACP methyl ester carboxylesterase n=1 Tax=Aureibacter tunicatorum TaxID=866807 RepID=A0AAE4BRH6_9BACT|nr:alpha/beta fold hydrolase [Aureibacter tunicatorum]MDR6237805.1 pimeloyl-ACP methyl ester carboxylesterase [Aureibacter tunicatorum]BDD02840.1 alpha/beta hydrolase [Aureibacter tunicatorum]
MNLTKKSGIIQGKHGKSISYDYQYNSDLDNNTLPTVIFVHGFKGYKDWGAFNLVAEYFAQRGCFFFKFNFSHNGTDPGHPNEFVDLEAFGNNNFSIERSDLGVVIDFVESLKGELPLETKSLSLIGHSRGGADVLMKALEDDRVKKLVTWASVLDVENFLSEELKAKLMKEQKIEIYNGRTNQYMPIYKQFMNDLLENSDIYNLKKRLKNLWQPLLICHGTSDEAVDYVNAEKINELAPNSELFLIDDAGHTFGAKEPWEESDLPKELALLLEKTYHFLVKS